MRRFTNAEEVEEARRRLASILDEGGEWFVREGGERPCEIRRGEWDVSIAGGALVLSYWGEAGARAWRVTAWAREGSRLLLEASRRTGATRATLELVPRARTASSREAVADARRATCAHVAETVRYATGSTLERASLSAGSRRGEPGRWARIILRRGPSRVAVSAPVVQTKPGDSEAFLSSTLLWFTRLADSPRPGRPRELWLAAPRPLSASLRERVPLLRAELREAISLFELDDEGAATSRLDVPELEELLETPATRLYAPAQRPLSETAARIVSLAPDSIDVVRARRGETLRFEGLPFARVRRLGDAEQAWFGIGVERRTPLDAATLHDFLKLIDDLKEHRRCDAPDRKHALYRAAPEAWLEASLRRDVTRLDPGLRLAPLHAQFRTSRAADADASRPVDLLALRRDGRLVVVELKVSEDAALALQGADYWRRVAAHHRAGHVRRARLFGDAQISQDPPLVYLVAPLLRFHRAFHTLARALRPEIEIYRFDLNEDWRSGVRVARRERVE